MTFHESETGYAVIHSVEAETYFGLYSQLDKIRLKITSILHLNEGCFKFTHTRFYYSVRSSTAQYHEALVWVRKQSGVKRFVFSGDPLCNRQLVLSVI